MPRNRQQTPQAKKPVPATLQVKFQQGLALHQQGKLADAEKFYQEVIQLEPRHFDAQHMLGVIALQTRRTQRGVEIIAKAIELNPNVAAAHSNLGEGLNNLKRPEQALASYDKAIALKPDLAEAHNNRGNALRDLGRHEEAIASYEKAIVLKPDYAEAHNNRGNALRKLTHHEEALPSYDKAIALKPDYAEAHYNRGNALKDLKHLEEAIASYDKAIALKPDYAEAYLNKSLLLLLMGRFEEGWRLYEWRQKPKLSRAQSYSQPLWSGKEDIAGKTLFVHCEQGLGDTIQFCRYATLAEAHGAKVIMSAQDLLMWLVKQLSPTIDVINAKSEPSHFDYHIPLLSMPLAFKTTSQSIPSYSPYLFADTNKQKTWKQQLGTKTKFRIGLTWSGSPEHTNDHNRSIALKFLEPLLELPIEFHSLQKEYREKDKVLLGKLSQLQDHNSELHDFSDTAALLSELDLVISVDTAVAHLAGALGKTVWILLPFIPDYRWMLDRSDSPWYPTAVLFRQATMGDWEGIIDKVRNRLVDQFTSSPPTPK